MTHEFLEHTADIRMRVTGGSLEEVFKSAAAGVMELLQPRSAAGGPPARPGRRRRSLALVAPDRTALLIDFLNAVLLGAQTHRERYDRIEFRRLTERDLAADLEGAPVEAFGGDVKAVTYHEAELRRGAEGSWSTVIVFDI